jgi:hypothetical protein
LNPFCDRIVPRSENDDNHGRFALHRVNKLRGLRYRSPTDSRRLHQLDLFDSKVVIRLCCLGVATGSLAQVKPLKRLKIRSMFRSWLPPRWSCFWAEHTSSLQQGIYFLRIPPSDGHPRCSANTSPCRVCRGLPPPSECALPDARKEKGRRLISATLVPFYPNQKSYTAH